MKIINARMDNKTWERMFKEKKRLDLTWEEYLAYIFFGEIKRESGK